MSAAARMKSRSVSARWIVVGVLGFGIGATGAIGAVGLGSASVAMAAPPVTGRAATSRRNNAADLLVSVMEGLTHSQHVRSAHSRQLTLALAATIDGWAESEPELAERLDEPVAAALEALGFLDEAAHHLSRAIERDREGRRQVAEGIPAAMATSNVTRGIRLARLWREIGRADAAVELLEELAPLIDGMRARTRSEYGPRLDRALGESLIDAGRAADAVEPLRRALSESTSRSVSMQSVDARMLARALTAAGAGSEALTLLEETIDGLRKAGTKESSSNLAELRVAQVSALRVAGRERDATALQRQLEEWMRFEERFTMLRSPNPDGWGELLVADGRARETERWLWRGIHALSMRGSRVPVGELRRLVTDVIDLAERRGDAAAAEAARQWLIRFERRFRSGAGALDEPDDQDADARADTDAGAT